MVCFGGRAEQSMGEMLTPSNLEHGASICTFEVLTGLVTPAREISKNSFFFTFASRKVSLTSQSF